MRLFYNCKALTGFFVDLVFTPERLKFPFRLSISVVDCDSCDIGFSREI